MTRDEADAVKLYLANGGMDVSQDVARVYRRLQRRRRQVLPGRVARRAPTDRPSFREKVLTFIAGDAAARAAAFDQEVEAARAQMGHLGGTYLGSGFWRLDDGRVIPIELKVGDQATPVETFEERVARRFREAGEGGQAEP